MRCEVGGVGVRACMSDYSPVCGWGGVGGGECRACGVAWGGDGGGWVGGAGGACLVRGVRGVRVRCAWGARGTVWGACDVPTKVLGPQPAQRAPGMRPRGKS